MDAFTALADPVRRELLTRLTDGPLRAGDLADLHPITRPAISRHLRVLRQTGLVGTDIVGRERHYRLERSGLVPVHRLLDQLGSPAGAESEADQAPRGRLVPEQLDALDTEVRRTRRERRHAPAREETA
ncbi:MAG: metalloregulator ArsR/SmtB family transcription factor [Ornithinimicrobium sp.]